jgi:hypothetical protein
VTLCWFSHRDWASYPLGGPCSGYAISFVWRLASIWLQGNGNAAGQVYVGPLVVGPNQDKRRVAIRCFAIGRLVDLAREPLACINPVPGALIVGVGDLDNVVGQHVGSHERAASHIAPNPGALFSIA